MKRFRDSMVSIQGLRWLAASLVVFVHAQQEMEKLAARRHVLLHFRAPLDYGLGVDIFFVISGFLIHHVSRRQFGVVGAPGVFIRRRMLRVLPLYWLATFAMLVAVLAVPSLLDQNRLDWAHVVASLMMLAYPDPAGHVFPLLSLGWTLNLEAAFYALFAVALLLGERAAMALLVVCLGAPVGLASVWPGAGWAVQFYGKPVVLEFAGGIGLSLIYAGGVRIGLRMAFLLGSAAILLHLALWDTALQAGRLLRNGVPAGLLFMACVFADRGLMRPMAANVVRLMGDASYALYLTSPFAINAAAELLSRAGVQSTTLGIAGACGAAMLLAVVVHQGVELKLTGLALRWLAARPRIDRRRSAA